MGHIIDARSIWFMEKCKQLNIPFSRIIEQFVELNHQTRKWLDKQTRRISHAEIMANSMCKNKALDYNAEINKQQQPGPVGLDAHGYRARRYYYRQYRYG